MLAKQHRRHVAQKRAHTALHMLSGLKSGHHGRSKKFVIQPLIIR